MNSRTLSTIAVISCLFGGVLLPARDVCADTVETVASAYPTLASGILAYATLAELPQGQILQSGSVAISQSDLEAVLDGVPSAVRDDLKDNLFFVLEQEAARKLLLDQAKADLAASSPSVEDENGLIQKYVENVLKDVRVDDAEVAAFYNENKDMFGGVAFEQVEGQLGQYVLQEKRQEAMSEHIRTWGRRHPISVSAAWVRDQAERAMNNPVDKARRSGKATLVYFGADGCRPCDMMAPIRENLKAKYKDQMNIEFVHVGEQRILAARYGIQSIPVQILFDKSGKEVWRHTGFTPQEQTEERLREIELN